MALDQWTYNPEDMDIQSLGEGEYTELRSSGKEQYSDGTSTANRVFELNWDERADFIDSLLGYSYLGADGTTIKRVPPDEHPQIDNFFASDATVEGKGVLGEDDDGVLSWTHAVVTANYKPRDYLILPDGNGTEQDRYTSRETDFNGEYLTLQNGMKFVTSKRVLAASPGRITSTIELTMTWREVPALPTPFIPPNLKYVNACIGRINSTTFDPGGYRFPPGTVLFIGQKNKFLTPKLGGSVGPLMNGLYMWDLSMKFIYRNNGNFSGSGSGGGMDDVIGHNFIFDITRGQWDLVTTTGDRDGVRIYPEAVDLNQLWQVGN